MRGFLINVSKSQQSYEKSIYFANVCYSYTMRDFLEINCTAQNALNFLEVQNSKRNLVNWSLETPHDIKMFTIATGHVRNISRLYFPCLNISF